MVSLQLEAQVVVEVPPVVAVSVPAPVDVVPAAVVVVEILPEVAVAAVAPLVVVVRPPVVVAVPLVVDESPVVVPLAEVAPVADEVIPAPVELAVPTTLVTEPEEDPAVTLELPGTPGDSLAEQPNTSNAERRKNGSFLSLTTSQHLCFD